MGIKSLIQTAATIIDFASDLSDLAMKGIAEEIVRNTVGRDDRSRANFELNIASDIFNRHKNGDIRSHVIDELHRALHSHSEGIDARFFSRLHDFLNSILSDPCAKVRSSAIRCCELFGGHRPFDEAIMKTMESIWRNDPDDTVRMQAKQCGEGLLFFYPNRYCSSQNPYRDYPPDQPRLRFGPWGGRLAYLNGRKETSSHDN